MTKTISRHRSGADPPRDVPTVVHYAFWGAVIGVLAGLATLFAIGAYYGAVTGLGPLDCVAVGAVTTLSLSQPAALVGLLVGAMCGGICASVGHFVHRSRSNG